MVFTTLKECMVYYLVVSWKLETVFSATHSNRRERSNRFQVISQGLRFEISYLMTCIYFWVRTFTLCDVKLIRMEAQLMIYSLNFHDIIYDEDKEVALAFIYIWISISLLIQIFSHLWKIIIPHSLIQVLEHELHVAETLNKEYQKKVKSDNAAKTFDKRQTSVRVRLL